MLCDSYTAALQKQHLPPSNFSSTSAALIRLLACSLVGDSVTEHNTVENIGRLFMAADELGYLTFVSPHWYYPYDQNWEFGGTIEKVMHDINMFARAGPLTLDGFENSGAEYVIATMKQSSFLFDVSPSMSFANGALLLLLLCFL